MQGNIETSRGPVAGAGTTSDDPAIEAVAAEWFSRRDAGLTDGEAQVFRRWLAADTRHRAALARLDSAWSTFGKPVRTGDADQLLDELATRAVRRRRRRVRAAAAALAVMLAIGASFRFPRHTGPTAPLPATAAILVPAQTVLSDGSVVILKDGAQIAVAFTAEVRRVELQRGEAMFEVAKNRPRPFVVAASGIEVRAVGTAFSVQLGAKAVDVLVTEGAVAVVHRGGSSKRAAGKAEAVERAPADAELGRQTTDDRLPAASSTADFRNPSSTLGLPSPGVLVRAGNRIVVEIAPTVAAVQVAPVAPAEIGERLAWRNPRVEFSGTPLAEAVALLNREAASRTGMQLRVSDPALASMRVSGIFRTDNMDAFVLLLEEGFGVQAERSGSAILLRKVPASPP